MGMALAGLQAKTIGNLGCFFLGQGPCLVLSALLGDESHVL